MFGTKYEEEEKKFSCKTQKKLLVTFIKSFLLHILEKISFEVTELLY